MPRPVKFDLAQTCACCVFGAMESANAQRGMREGVARKDYGEGGGKSAGGQDDPGGGYLGVPRS